jgi:hypothetical protein
MPMNINTTSRILIVWLLLTLHITICTAHCIIPLTSHTCIHLQTGSSTRRRRHKCLNKLLIIVMSLDSIILLNIDFLLNEFKKLLLWHIFEVSHIRVRCLLHEPLKDLLIGILSPLLIGYVIAEGWLLIEGGDRICGLFEASFQAVQVRISSINHWEIRRERRSICGSMLPHILILIKGLLTELLLSTHWGRLRCCSWLHEWRRILGKQI